MCSFFLTLMFVIFLCNSEVEETLHILHHPLLERHIGQNHARFGAAEIHAEYAQALAERFVRDLAMHAVFLRPVCEVRIGSR